MSQIETSSDRAFSFIKRITGSQIINVVSAFLIVILVACNGPSKQDHQGMIHDMGSHVMPFDISKTLHIFEMTVDGGIQQVVLRDTKDDNQLSLIRRHLKEEAVRFSEGDYSDPMSIHGNEMPGIKELEVSASKIKITYQELPDGAQISYKTPDIRLITAIHSWFGAQLSDHGADATYR